VRDHEPRRALVSGPTGLEALEHVIDHAPEWLATPSVMVCEIAPHQAAAVVERARVAGFRDAFVRADLAERPRVLVARRD
jgi:release factor glutamine methyltransferase